MPQTSIFYFYILSQQKLSHRQVHWVEVLTDYALNFVCKPGYVLSTPDILSRMPILHIIVNNQALLEAVCLAQKCSAEQEFLHFKHLATQPKSDFHVTQGLIVRRMSGSSPLVISSYSLGLCQKVLAELHTSPLGGYLGYCKLLGLIYTLFWWSYLAS